MRRNHFFAVLAGLVAIALVAADASAMYHPTLGRFLQRDPIGYADSMTLHQYANGDPETRLDPYGLGTCHIWAYLPEDRTEAGDLFLYCADGKLWFYAPVRGMGLWQHRKDPDRTKQGRNTPSGDYEGKVEPPQGNSPNDEYGQHDVVRMTGRRYGQQPQIAGEMADRAARDPGYEGRGGLLIHGGRQDRATERRGTTYDVKQQKRLEGTAFRRPMGTSGCLRLNEADVLGLAKLLKSEECCCEQTVIHVREEAAPEDPAKLPAWSDPRKLKKPVG